MKIVKLKKFANQVRKNIIYTAYKAGAKSAHIGSHQLRTWWLFFIQILLKLKIKKN